MKKAFCIFLLFLTISFPGCARNTDSVRIGDDLYICASETTKVGSKQTVYVSGKCTDVYIDAHNTIHCVLQSEDNTAFDVIYSSTDYSDIQTLKISKDTIIGNDITAYGFISNIDTSDPRIFIARYIDIDETRYSDRIDYEDLYEYLGASELSDFFQRAIAQGAVMPDYEIYGNESGNDKKDTLIVMNGAIDRAYNWNGILVLDFLEGESKNPYALFFTNYSESTAEMYNSLIGQEFSVIARYTKYSEPLELPMALFFSGFCDGEYYGYDLDTKSFVPTPTPLPTASPTPKPTPNPTFKPTSDPATPQSGTVWIPTNGGTKYHSKSTCSGMNDPQQVTVEEAKSLGFEPCKKCYG